MKLTLERTIFTDTYTVGKLLMPNLFLWTAEDKDRGLTSDMTAEEIAAIKVKGETCIPYGEYKVKLSYSPKFKMTLPELVAVKGFTGIRVHAGNTAKDSMGCILLGMRYDEGGKILQSKKAVNEVFIPFVREVLKGSDLILEIKKGVAA